MTRLTDKHTVSRALNLLHGRAFYPAAQEIPGIVFTPLALHHFGKAAAKDADALIDAATSTELPNAATKTYEPGSAPFDGALVSDGRAVLDVPRNVVAAAAHDSSVVAMTIVVTGLDVYGEVMVEQLSIAATGTSQSATGKKAFAEITSIAITAAGDATANTLDIGTGDALGLPHRVDANELMLAIVDGGLDSSPTFAPADTDTATATTGDIRGTVTFNDVPDGTSTYSVLYKVADVRSKVGAYGITQFSG